MMFSVKTLVVLASMMSLAGKAELQVDTETGKSIRRRTQELQIIVGDYLLYNDTTGQRIGVREVKIHETFVLSTYVNDIAILTLTQPIKYFTNNPCIAPICLDPTFVPRGIDCMVAGWGANRQASSELKMTAVTTFSGYECLNELGMKSPRYMSDIPNQFCARCPNGKVDSCNGDSGGPLVCLDPATNTYAQVGIVSYGHECALAGFPGVYTRVAACMDWIGRN